MTSLSSILLRSIPEAAQAGLANGNLAVFGSVIRSTKTGQIVYHLQETGVLGQWASTLLMPGGPQLEAAKLAGQFAGDALLYRQGQQIKEAVDLLSQRQWANLLLSGATLGVSVAGFAVLANRINRIEGQISSLDQRLVELKCAIETLRDDRIAEDLSLLRSIIQQMDESWTLRQPTAQLDRVASESHILANRFFDRAKGLLANEGPRLSLAAPMIDAFAIAQSTRVSARIASEELETAHRASEEAVGQYCALLESADATHDVLARLRTEEIGTLEDWAEHLDTMLGQPREISAALRSRAEAMDGTRELVIMLKENGLSGCELMHAARSEGEAPVLVLPVALDADFIAD